MLVRRRPPALSLWKPPNGGYPTSWTWSNRDADGDFRILVSHPGALYRLGGRGKAELSVPALDHAPTTMLSPALDRAVAFGSARSQGYLVDFSNPRAKLPIAVTGSKSIGRLILGWGAWSPDGKQIALLMAEKDKREAFELYVGDPAGTMRQVMRGGLRFSVPLWASQANSEGSPGPGPFVWAGDSKSIYCRMTDPTKTRGRAVHYVLARIDLPT